MHVLCIIIDTQNRKMQEKTRSFSRFYDTGAPRGVKIKGS